MEIKDLIGTAVDCMRVGDEDAAIDPTKRAFLRGAGLMIASLLLPRVGAAAGATDKRAAGQKVVLVMIGGVRRAETFAREGLENIPHLVELFPRSLFYAHARNEGVTAHFNAISSILTGNWQRVDDWGKLAPTTPTLFEQFRKSLHVDRRDTWVVASNKALTSLIGASSDASFGPTYGANVVFPKQLMLQAIEDALRAGRTGNMADRSKVEAELERALEGSNYEGLGWNVFDAAEHLDPEAQASIRGGHRQLCAQRRANFRRRAHLLHYARDHAQVCAQGAGGSVFRCGSCALRLVFPARLRHPDGGSPRISALARGRNESRVQGTNDNVHSAGVWTGPGWFVDKRVLQPSGQRRLDPGYLDDGSGSSGDLAAGH